MCWLNCHVRYCSNQSSVAGHIQLHAWAVLCPVRTLGSVAVTHMSPTIGLWMEMLRRGELQTAPLGGGVNMSFHDSWWRW